MLRQCRSADLVAIAIVLQPVSAVNFCIDQGAHTIACVAWGERSRLRCAVSTDNVYVYIYVCDARSSEATLSTRSVELERRAGPDWITTAKRENPPVGRSFTETVV